MVFAPGSHNVGNLVQGEQPKIRVEYGWGRSSQQKTCNISETGQDRTKVTIDDFSSSSAYALSIGTKIIDLGWPDDLEAWRAIMHPVSKNVLTTKIWMKIGP